MEADISFNEACTIATYLGMLLKEALHIQEPKSGCINAEKNLAK